ncbi:MAG: type II secretion system F family protein [Atopobiaceae bacterium]|nr:type II secretion system F family protein [Atopobiaceae bacterium]
MAATMLESSALSAFFGSVATMLSAGIQTDEAVHMLSVNRDESQFKDVCAEIYSFLIQGDNLAGAMEKCGAFPQYAIDMVATGEQSGRLDNVLRNLDEYYDEEHRMYEKLRTSVSYPAALLCIMSVILAFTVAVILPVFIHAYENMSGSLTGGSHGFVTASIAVGWIALIVTLVCTVVVLIATFMSRSPKGRERLTKFLEKLPATKGAMYQMALSRCMMALATYTSSGIDNETAMTQAQRIVDHEELSEKLGRAHDAMIDSQNPRSLTQAIAENDLLEPVYARMLVVGNRSGSLDQVLARLSEIFFDDAIDQVDLLIGRVEPVLAAFLTITVGGTLIAVMIPLIGIMRSIG